MSKKTITVIIILIVIILIPLFFDLKVTNDYVPDGYETKYADFVEAVKNMDKKYVLPKKEGTPAQLYEEVWILHPEIFWIKNKFLYTYDENNYYVSVYYTCPKPIAKWRQFRLDLKVNSIVRKAKKQKNQTEMLRYIHDYLIEKSQYATYRQSVGTIYGCIIQGESLCQGYTNAFTVLANKCGIECGPVINSDHVWNYVIVDGKEYMIDVTWDDPIGGKAEDPYKYFMLTPEEMKKDHPIRTDYCKYSKDKTDTKK